MTEKFDNDKNINPIDGKPFPKLGWSAGIVKIFIESKLSLLLILGSVLLGIMALLGTPREEDPQIIVPVVDILVEMPGATADEVERLAAMSLESLLSEISGIEHVYSMSHPGWCLVTARFYVGEDREKSLTKVFTQIQANENRVPHGIRGWRIFPVDIDDVPIVTVSFFSKELNDADLRSVAQSVITDLRSINNVGRTEIYGGRKREVKAVIDPARLASYGLTPLEVIGALQGANRALPAGSVQDYNREIPVRTGPFLRTAEDIAKVIVGVSYTEDGSARPIYAEQVCSIIDGPEEPVSYSRFGFGPAAKNDELNGYSKVLEYPSVTISIAKKKGANAVWVAEKTEERMKELKEKIIPNNVEYRITRNYGESANEKVNELSKHLGIAVITVVVLLGLSLGWREAWIVAIAVPMTLAVTLFADLAFGYTINRVTLFALILSLGLLVDDPIVDVENIFRHFKLRRFPPKFSALFAVDEIRPPTILATFTVIVSFLPMFFITGMMGPYMAPMAFNVPISMLMSLLVAFTVTPWAAYYLLKHEYDIPAPKFELTQTGIYKRYNALVRPLLESRKKSFIFLSAIFLLFLVSVSMVPLGLVPVKMLPFANKDEILLVVDAPEDFTVEKTDAVLAELAALVRTLPEAINYQTYSGQSSPIDFNGLVRQYFLRKGGNVGDLRINLLNKIERKASSHEIALRLRPEVDRIAEKHGVIVKVVETPPGPPVLAQIVAEVRGSEGASYSDIIDAARKVKSILAETPHSAEVDWTVESEHERIEIEVDREKAALAGVTVQDAVLTMRFALAGEDAGGLRENISLEQIPIRLRLPQEMRSETELLDLRVRGNTGALVPLSEISCVKRVPVEHAIYHKDQKRVVYVTAEASGISPVNILFNADAKIKKILTEGYEVFWRGEGEWKITTDAFRDLGLAFGTACVMIYILLVAQTASLAVPVVIMLAIPLTMIGVFPGFWILNLIFASPVGSIPNPIFFTATGMIGLIALAGIVVRNSIILIDFIEVLQREGKPLHDAIIEAGATRLRPIFLTAAAALMGAWIIVLDPIFSGMAWSFIFGIVVSTSFTLILVPVAYNILKTSFKEKKEE